MIIRHIPMNSARQSSFLRLLHYITHSQSKQERVGRVRISNCQQENLEWAAHEIMATQAKNQRARGDKSYHLLISFAPGENPSPEELKRIEARVVESIGLKAHQRISAVHHDTDNLHIHVAINKIHPSRYTLIEPYRAYHQFAKTAEALEVDFNLQKTNHVARKVRAENRASDMEHHRDMESLLTWIQRHCREPLLACSSWASFHQVLAAHGLQGALRGNGLVLVAKGGLMVKASSVARTLSKATLEKRLGPFNPAGIEEKPPEKTYAFNPVNKRAEAARLYTQYEAARSDSQQTIADGLAVARQRKSRLIRQLKENARFKRAAVKITRDGSKKMLYALISQSVKKELAHIHREYNRTRKELYSAHRRMSWQDWLKKEAIAGNAKALNCLRSRQQASKSREYAFTGVVERDQPSFKEVDSLTNQGTAIYRSNECTIRDYGLKLTISRGISVEGLKKAIEMAQHKFGRCLSVKGTERFKEAILKTTVHFNLPVTFADRALEEARQALTRTKEKNSEQSGFIHGGDVGRGHEAFGRGGAKITPLIRRARPSHPPAWGTKPHPFSTGAKPSPENQNRLRSLSELHVVQFARRSEVLLPSHAPNQLERQGAEPHHPVRRAIFGIKKKNGRKVF